jgi:hypothetical protein
VFPCSFSSSVVQVAPFSGLPSQRAPSRQGRVRSAPPAPTTDPGRDVLGPHLPSSRRPYLQGKTSRFHQEHKRTSQPPPQRKFDGNGQRQLQLTALPLLTRELEVVLGSLPGSGGASPSQSSSCTSRASPAQHRSTFKNGLPTSNSQHVEHAQYEDPIQSG